MPVVGGGRPAHLDRGWFVEPTVFRDVKNDMRIAQEEIFGPVVAFIPYTDEEEAIAVVNASAFGLRGTVWTSDVEKGVEVGRRIRTGTYSVSAMSLDPATPFGGIKQSGLEREMGPKGLPPTLSRRPSPSRIRHARAALTRASCRRVRGKGLLFHESALHFVNIL